MILRCPLFEDCDTEYDVSEDDPDSTLTDILHHLEGWPHYRTHPEAMHLLALVEEVE